MNHIYEGAADMLLNNRLLPNDMLLPKVYIVGGEISIFLAAALRGQRNLYSLTGKRFPINEVTIHDAYSQAHHGRKIPEKLLKLVDWNFNSVGSFDENEFWYKWQKDMYRDNNEYYHILCPVVK